MSSQYKKEIKQQLKNLWKVYSGETVNGVKLGDAGITLDWVKQTIQNLSAMI